MSDEENHFLSEYLSIRLPELGLDYETYGPYCFGAVSSDVGDASSDEEEDYEEIDGIIDLLRSSSESHCDDDAAWSDLRTEIIRLTVESRNNADAKKHEEILRAKEAEEEKIRKAKAEAEEYEKLLEQKAHEKDGQDEEKVKAREALLNRFAYEKEDDGATGGGGKGNDGEDGPVSNKDAAAQAQKDHVRKVREESSKSKESKQSSRMKTKEANKAKADKKEERRKRAVKGERKR